MDDLIISAHKVHKTYDTGAGKVHALRAIDLQVRRGEMVAIMGLSGCGKTTLLNCLPGLDEIDSGQVQAAQEYCPVFREEMNSPLNTGDGRRCASLPEGRILSPALRHL